MQILVCNVGQQAKVENIEQELKEFQRLVDGYIEFVTISDDGILLCCNEEGKLLGLPLNRIVPARAPLIPEGFQVIYSMEDPAAPGTMGIHKIHGDFFLCRSDEEGDVAPLSNEDVERYKPYMDSLMVKEAHDTELR